MNKYGFTLAEVLLTLAIIGVVAALTIPAVITKVTKDQYVVALKKTYNTLKSVEREAVREHGAMENWSWGSPNSYTDFNKYFKTYFDILKDCGDGSDDGCFAASYSEINGTTVSSWVDTELSQSSKLITPDGISIAYNAVGDTQHKKGTYIVDLNGKKSPNRVGRDLFAFAVFDNAGIKPSGSLDPDTKSILSNIVDTSCKETGDYCTAKVLSEGAMNY